ncbi:VOC family protein [Actinoplanes sp. NPDC020271]|uniref:VOC family protein n=1 Tax=Actinoplanes sp. NPDC020271 TaxID=3363896 RepID=UPI0037B797BE
MHRSRLFGMLVDTPASSAPAAADFWAAALGGSAHQSVDEPEYTRITGTVDGFAMVVQSVDDQARIHLDIETDDVQAESERLLALGATLVTDNGGHKILRAPGGHLLCVVPVQSPADIFTTTAQSWP